MFNKVVSTGAALGIVGGYVLSRQEELIFAAAEVRIVVLTDAHVPAGN